MKLSYKIDNVKTKNLLNIAFDVSKDDLYMYTEIGSDKINCIQDQFSNSVTAIESKLKEYKTLAKENDYENIQVICEPTGGYEKKLMLLARQQGCYTAYASGESVCKYKVIENNESSKTDIKDPRVILLVAKFGKLIKHRILPEEYNLLRHLNRMHEQEEEQKICYKNQLHGEMKSLFCDFSYNSGFLYESSGRVLVERFQCNPYRIVRMGYSKFSKTMKKYVKYIKTETLKRIWSDAQRSVRLIMPDSLIELLEQRIKELWQNYLRHEQSLKKIKDQMYNLYQKLLDEGENLPRAEAGFVSQVNLARIIGETGPFEDFNHYQQIIRFSGLSLKQRQSGKYKGKDKVSKKGSSRLRMILSQSIFHLIKKDRVLGEYYHRKKAEGMPGTKAMAVVSRKLVAVLFALSKPGAVYDPARLFTCESQYKKVA
jgi:transposase